MNPPAPTPETLDAATIKALTWKPTIVRNVAIRIVSQAVEAHDRIFWADNIDFDFIGPSDSACIGLAWRMLVKVGILKRTDLNRRSIKESSRGRVVFKYRVACLKRAAIFLERNGWSGRVGPKGEQFLFPIEELNRIIN